MCGLWEMDLIEGIKTAVLNKPNYRLSGALWEMDLIEGIKTPYLVILYQIVLQSVMRNGPDRRD